MFSTFLKKLKPTPNETSFKRQNKIKTALYTMLLIDLSKKEVMKTETAEIKDKSKTLAKTLFVTLFIIPT